MPKSVLPLWSMMFAGLMSRWTMPLSCSVIERIGGLAEDVERHRMRRYRLRFQERFESRAVDALHGDVGEVAVSAHFENDHDSGMGERAGGAGFAEKAVEEEGGVPGGVDANGLYGDGAADEGVDGFVDDSHAAASQLARDLEAANLLHWRIIHSSGGNKK
jgi:hypothetical protein